MGVAAMEVAVGWATVTVSEVSGSGGVGSDEGGGFTIAVVGGALSLPAHCRHDLTTSLTSSTLATAHTTATTLLRDSSSSNA